MCIQRNNKVKTFYSFYPDPLASGVDAFSFDWSQDIICAFPPFNLIPHVLQKVENQKTEGIFNCSNICQPELVH